MMPPAVLGAVLMFSVLAFASTEQWALSIVQLSIFALAVFYSIKGTLRFHRVAFIPAAAACLGIAQVVAGSTVYKYVSLNAAVQWVACFLLFVVSMTVFATANARRNFQLGLLYAGCLIAAVSTAQYFSSNGLIYWIFPVRAGRPFGPFVNPDHYAALMELIIPIGIDRALRDRTRSWLYAGIVGVLYGSVVASASRAGLALTTSEILVIPLLARRVAVTWKVIGALLICAGAGLSVAGVEVVGKKFQEQDLMRYRREIVRSTIKMVAQRPWTGFGLGTYETVYPEFASFDIGRRVDHAHNDWAEWASEGGIPLLLLIGSLAVLSLPRAASTGWGLGVHAICLHSLVDFPLQIPALAFLMFALLGALYAESGGSYVWRTSATT